MSERTWDDLSSLENIWYQTGKASAVEETHDAISYHEGFETGFAKATEISIELSALRLIFQRKLFEMERKEIANLRLKKRLDETIRKIDNYPTENIAEFDFEVEMELIRSAARSVGISFAHLEFQEAKYETSNW